MKFVIKWYHWKKSKNYKLNLKQKIIGYLIEPTYDTIDRNEYETRDEPVVGVGFEQE